MLIEGILTVGIMIVLATFIATFFLLRTKKISVMTSLSVTIIALSITIRVITEFLIQPLGERKKLGRRVRFIFGIFPMLLNSTCSEIAKVIEKISIAQLSSTVQYRSVRNRRSSIRRNARKDIEEFQFA